MKPLNNNIKKSLVAIVISASLFTTTTQAHEDQSHKDNSCEVNLDAGFSIDKNKIQFLEKEVQTNSDGEEFNPVIYTIIDDNKLIVKGESIDLNKDQKALVSEYSKSIRQLVPEIREVALEGVDLALEGVNMAFNGLLGEDSGVSSDLTSDIEVLRDDISQRFTIEHGFTVGVEGENGDDLLGKDIEESIEKVVEKTIKNSMGTILVAVGKELMFSGDTDAFETKMEAFGENIENEMEARAEKIEVKAQSLCLSVVEIDELETQLQNNIEALEDINVITVDVDSNDDAEI